MSPRMVKEEALSMWLVLLYLGTVVVANLSVFYFGPTSTLFNAFFLIALDLTTRDGLHERWYGKHLWAKMFGLIFLGSLFSWLANHSTAQIALASCIAFITAGLADAVVYQFLFRHSRFVKLNGSNLVASAVDSFLFPAIAFGSFIWWATLGQFFAKVAGGYIWSLILRKTLWKREIAGIDRVSVFPQSRGAELGSASSRVE